MRKVAGRIGVQPPYLSKVERGQGPPPSEAKIPALPASWARTPTSSSP